LVGIISYGVYVTNVRAAIVASALRTAAAPTELELQIGTTRGFDLGRAYLAVARDLGDDRANILDWSGAGRGGLDVTDGRDQHNDAEGLFRLSARWRQLPPRWTRRDLKLPVLICTLLDELRYAARGADGAAARAWSSPVGRPRSCCWPKSLCVFARECWNSRQLSGYRPKTTGQNILRPTLECHVRPRDRIMAGIGLA